MGSDLPWFTVAAVVLALAAVVVVVLAVRSPRTSSTRTAPA